MLVDFAVKNYLSFKGEIVFSMLAANSVKENENDGLFSNVHNEKETNRRILKVASIYGANGSGKSNFIKALAFFKRMIINSYKDDSILKKFGDRQFLYEENNDNSTGFEINIIINGTKYRYGFEIEKESIATEWLYIQGPKNIKERYSFMRNNNEFKTNGIKGAKQIMEVTRDNSLFLSTLALSNVVEAKIIKDWFQENLKIISGVDEDTVGYTADQYNSSEKMHNLILDRISRAYGLTENYDDFNHLCNENEKLREIIGPFTGMRSSCPENLFELSVLTILLQNTTVKRSRDMLDAILRLAGNTVHYDGLELACFCTPESLFALGTDRLRNEARVGYRDKTLLSLAKFFMEEPVEYTGVSKEKLLTTICKVKGIGPYTAGVVAGSIFHDHRAYGLDVWNRKIIKHALGVNPEMNDKDLKKYLTEVFSPCEGLVVEAIVEMAYLYQPVCRLYSSEQEAKHASFHWPR